MTSLQLDRDQFPIDTPSLARVDTRTSAELLADDRRKGKLLDDYLAAASESVRLAGNMAAKGEAMSDAIDNRIETVQRVTGLQLENPLRGGYFRDASQRVNERVRNGEVDNQHMGAAIANEAVAIFNEKVDGAATQFPDKAAALNFGQSIAQQAGAIASNAEDAAAIARQRGAAAGLSGFDLGVADVFAGLWGSRRDPLTVLSLFFGPSTAVGRTTLARVGSSALNQGLFNVGLAQLEKPAVEAWRRERGLQPGGQLLSPSEVGLAFAMGAIPGAGFAVGHEIGGHLALGRVMRGEALPGDVAKAVRHLGLPLDPDTARVVAAGERSIQADGLVDARPPGVPQDLHEAATRQAIAHAENPDAVAPPPLPVIGPHDLPEPDLSRFATLNDAVAWLREEPGRTHAALQSNRADTRLAGRLAALSDEAWGMVRDGGASPATAAIVHELGAPREQHAAIIEHVERARPANLSEARTIAADAIEGETDRRARAEIARRQAEPELPLAGADTVPAMPAHRVVAANGQAIDVRPVVVEASSLVTSADAGFDKTLQPRQRDRAAAQAQVRDIAANLEPERLGASSEADRGAPIVGRDRQVESGNGRVLALRQVYAERGPQAQRYREYLAQQGVDVSRFNEPVLVRERLTDLAPGERQAFTVAANQPATLAMSASERALADARHITPDMLALIQSADLGAGTNRDFVRAFLGAVPASERGALLDATGGLSAEGLARVRNAVLARAYGDAPVLARVAEATSDDVKGISSALTAVAPEWAKLRADIEAGRVRADMDLTAALTEAVSRTVDARAKGLRLADYLAQRDAFDTLAAPVETFMRMFYDPKLRRAASSQRIADALAFYVEEARKVSAEHGLDLGLEPVKPGDIQELAARKGAGDEATQGGPVGETAVQPAGGDRGGAGGGAGGAEVQRPEPGAGSGGAGEAGAVAAPEPQAPATLDRMIPFVREDGSAILLTPDALGQVGERERHLSDIMGACKAA